MGKRRHGEEQDLGDGWLAIWNAMTQHWTLLLVPLDKWMGSYPTIQECQDRKDAWFAKV